MSRKKNKQNKDKNVSFGFLDEYREVLGGEEDFQQRQKSAEDTLRATDNLDPSISDIFDEYQKVADVGQNYLPIQNQVEVSLPIRFHSNAEKGKSSFSDVFNEEISNLEKSADIDEKFNQINAILFLLIKNDRMLTLLPVQNLPSIMTS